ncbi:Glycerate 3-kinase [Aquirufa nivalisilvae]|uniref:Glycerate 3-kinase n=1 Tax=Aquirufa nivalisilvae TaxID=2516557 RepID=A0A2S2DS25_9BACT|nr:glycerate kinase [Aquirufa nivalisilvae]AWL08109.1 Glycerate 3-kinase [Aquirufa nivalisilvae]
MDLGKLLVNSTQIHVMRVLLCPDKFKDSLTAAEVCQALAQGIKKSYPEAIIQSLPLADGGEGTLDVIQEIFGGEWVKVMVKDPLFRNIEAPYLWVKDRQHAFIEMSRASGIELLKKEERNPGVTSTFGTGELILHALKLGAKQITVTVGGSATNDAGMGMAAALGFLFLDEQGNELAPKGENLVHIRQIIPSPIENKLRQIQFQVATDVRNVLHGAQGAAHVFAKQKGADEEMIRQLNNGLINMSTFFPNNEIAQSPGAGAAGGLGAGAMFFLQASIHLASAWILDLVAFDQHASQADVIISGEGKIDVQSWEGKLISTVIQHSQTLQKPIILVCGGLQDRDKIPESMQHIPVYPILVPPISLEEAITQASTHLVRIGESLKL